MQIFPLRRAGLFAFVIHQNRVVSCATGVALFVQCESAIHEKSSTKHLAPARTSCISTAGNIGYLQK